MDTGLSFPAEREIFLPKDGAKVLSAAVAGIKVAAKKST
jgi:hypothetical protein